MENRKLGIILVILGLILLGLIIYFLFFFNFQEDISILTGRNNQTQVTGLAENENQLNEGPQKVIKEITIVKDEYAKPVGEAKVRETELKKLAMSFAERFGSYSNHSDFSNVVDLKIFMTDSMQKWADNFVEVGRATLGDTSVFQGVITKSITSEIKKYDINNGVAEILVQTQKVATNGETNEANTTYQDILITFVKGDREWQVDNAEWQ